MPLSKLTFMHLSVLFAKFPRQIEVFAALPCAHMQGGRGQWAVYYISPQSFKITFFFVGLTTLGTLIEFGFVCS